MSAGPGGRRGPRRIGTLALLVAVLSLGLSASLPPSVSATTPAGQLLPPYSGVRVFTNHSAIASGCGSTVAHAIVGPGFNTTTGTVHMGSTARAASCASTGGGNYSGYAEEDVGLSGPCWSPAVAGNVSILINFSFDYAVNVSARTGPVQSYPYASYQTLTFPWVRDTTTGKSSSAQGDYHNSTVFDSANGSYRAVIQKNITFIVKQAQHAGDTYCLELFSYEEVHVWVGAGAGFAQATINIGSRGFGERLTSLVT